MSPLDRFDVTDDMIERAAMAFYEADKDDYEATWDKSSRMTRDEYRKAARIVLVAASEGTDQ
jgi:hypothetical protein